ncbi:hypothetical protein EST38_g8800 [Candolleomyces aberdarensis]|uniref:Fungal-type protein kinase domain-containing protein n=1 Tax=Candolleomyces aberdarensis TaxID=2316362 RepID=A0A4Q2DBK8_9AGAR|nr:hypothetical protein EST38_g8800 [Candolleomyces aberdarensis]
MKSTTFAPYSTEEDRDPVEVLGDHFAQDLGHNTPMTDKAWAHSLYLKVTTLEDIEDFMKVSGEYKNGRWARIPQTPSSAATLRQPFCKLVNSMLGNLAPGAGASRVAVNSRANRFEGQPIEGMQHRCSPDIVVKASGSSFSLPKGLSLGFSNAATCFDTKLDEEVEECSRHLSYHAAYAKYMFAHQPNRMFVRSLVITENRARLFHFDRSGAQYTPLFNIHDEPATFIRLILGLCSADERTLGFDDTVQWSVAANGSKGEGTVRTIGPGGAIVTYLMVMEESPFTRNNLRGRGTTCWAVKDAKGNRFIIKDYWISEGQDAEFKLLEEAKGLLGVCQMVSYEENRIQTKDFRGNVEKLEKSTFHNRTSTRIVMKAYGPSIENFSSVMQVLAALRDAIAAHRLLLSKNIVHRDISPNNISLGKDGAEEGIRGILIDLDAATKCGVFGPQDRADHKIGTRLFQSFTVLNTSFLKPHDVSAHDYLDDLEAFFWVFSYLLIAYKADDTRAPESFLHNYLKSWDGEPAQASPEKFVFLYQSMIGAKVIQIMDEGWRCACADLFIKLRKYMREIADRKDELLCELRGTEENGAFPNHFSSILEDPDKHYDHILGLFDEALKKATEAVEPESASQPTSPTKAAPTSTLTHTPVERVSLTPLPQPTLPSVSNQSTPVKPTSSTSSFAAPPTPTRRPKRRCQEAELEDSCIEVKRKCPPSRRPLRTVVEPSLYVLNSLYQYCLKWI